MSIQYLGIEELLERISDSLESMDQKLTSLTKWPKK
jgi:hypothetical protein